MKNLCKKIAAFILTVLLVCSISAPAFASDAKGVEYAKNGVVSIQFYLKDAALYALVGDELLLQESLGDRRMSRGSGFFVGDTDEDPTYIVTNNHVVEDYINANEGGTYVVQMGYYTDSDGDQFPRVLGATSCELRVYYDEDTYDMAYVDCYGDVDKVDLAVLTIRNATDKRHALPIRVPTSDMVSETVYTVGFPGNAENDFTSASSFGLDDITVHKGSITRFAANDKGVERIQIDATVQHGNSGGPLVMADGSVIGVNTNVYSQSPYEEQIEADYYAINASELVKFLDKNNIPWEPAKDGGFPVGIVAAVVIAIAIIAAVVIWKMKKPAPQPAPQPVSPTGPAPQPVPQPEPKPIAGDSGLRIQGLTGQFAGRRFAIAGQLRVGRDPARNDLVYPADTQGVSGVHCVLIAEGDHVLLRDLGSTYGTFVAGSRLAATETVTLQPGDRFFLGSEKETFMVARKGEG